MCAKDKRFPLSLFDVFVQSMSQAAYDNLGREQKPAGNKGKPSLRRVVCVIFARRIKSYLRKYVFRQRFCPFSAA